MWFINFIKYRFKILGDRLAAGFRSMPGCFYGQFVYLLWFNGIGMVLFTVAGLDKVRTGAIELATLGQLLLVALIALTLLAVIVRIAWAFLRVTGGGDFGD